MPNTGNTQQQINYGAAANDGLGDPLRTAFIKTDENFDNIWLAGPVGSNITITNNTIAVNNTNGNLVLSPNATGIIQTRGSLQSFANNLHYLGTANLRYLGGYFGPAGLDVTGNVTAGNISTGGFSAGELTATGLTVNGDAQVTGNLRVQGDIIQVGNIVTDTLTIQLANTAANGAQANGAGITVGAADDIATLLYSSGGNGWTTNIGVTVAGNITGDYIFGNAAFLTGLPEQYSNANVANYLPIYSGNISSGNLSVSSSGNTWVISGQQITAPSSGVWRSEVDSNDDFITSAANGYINLQSLYASGNIASELHLEHGLAQIRVADGPFAEWTFRNTGELTVPGNIIPDTSNVYSLGNVTNQWAELWVANSTIYLGGVPIGIGAGNVLTVNGADVVTTSDGEANIGNLTIYSATIAIASGAPDTDVYISPSGESWAFLQLPINDTANVTNTRLHNDAGNVEIAAGDFSNGGPGYEWVFDKTGNLVTPGNLVVGPAPGGVGSSILQYDAPFQMVGEGANAFVVSGWTANTNAPDSIAVVAFNAPYTGGASNVQIAVGNNATTVNYWTFGNDGTTTFPMLTVDLHNGGNQAGRVLQFGDDSQQAIITGPTPAVDNNAQRLIIQGQAGNGTGEGGDVYLWGGDAEFNGGDIKIYAGDADNVASGSGGYVNIEGGSGFDNGGYASLRGGQSNNGQGAYAQVVGGYGVSGGDANITGGQGYAGAGGTVNITGGTSGNGLAEYGNVNITAGATTWTFDNTGTLTAPGNLVGSGSASPAPYITGFSSVETIDAANLAGTGFSTTGITLIGGTGVVESSANTVSIYSDSNQLNGILFYGDGSGNDGVDIYAGQGLTVFANNAGSSKETRFLADGTISVQGMIYPTNGLTDIDIGNSTNSFRDGYFTGNITANSFIGDGSQLTGLPASYGNSNVATFLAAFGSNTISTTGNITAGNFTGNITITGNVTGTSSNVELVAGSYEWTFDNAGNLTLPGNTFSVNYANGTQVVLGGGGGSYGDSNVVTLLSSFGSNTISTTGNITAGNIRVTGNSTTGVNSLLAGVTNTPLSNTVAAFSANVNSYTQATLQNKSTGADATADWILTADNGSDTVNYGDFGIINSGYDVNTPTNSLGNIVYAADTYIYAQGNTSNTAQSGGNLVIGTTTPTKSVKIFAGGANNSALVTNISNTGVSVTGAVSATGNVTAANLSLSGNIVGSSANVTITANAYVTTFDTTGTATFPGAVQLAVYANTTVRDTAILSPLPGMMIYVTGTGMQVRGATQWNTISGSGT